MRGRQDREGRFHSPIIMVSSVYQLTSEACLSLCSRHFVIGQHTAQLPQDQCELAPQPNCKMSRSA